jgi:cation diffusion facilitator CzcD-associated flavoprotein CzcO
LASASENGPGFVWLGTCRRVSLWSYGRGVGHGRGRRRPGWTRRCRLPPRQGLFFRAPRKIAQARRSLARGYESLWLHTDKRHSELPGVAYPKCYPRYVPKGQFLAYLETFAQRFDLHPWWGEEAVSARRVGELWELRTASSVYRARNLVVATGHASRPNWPGWPGFDSFHGPVVHSSRYRNPFPYVGKRVLVVGFGNSGGNRQGSLRGRGHPTISVRGPVNLVPREFWAYRCCPWQYRSHEHPPP